MDTATRLAMRAVVGGLTRSGAVEDPTVRTIMEELSKVADLRKQWGHEHDVEQLLGLAADIGIDAKLVD